MDISYKRDINKSIMVIRNISSKDGYEKRMISQNNIRGILKCREIKENNSLSLWYDITGMKSLKTFFSIEGIDAESIKVFFLAINKTLKILDKYLLNARYILLGMDTLFLKNERGDWKAYMPYIVNEEVNFLLGLQTVGEYLIQNVDHQNIEATSLCYSIFEKTKEKSVTISEILDLIKPTDHYVEKQGREVLVESENLYDQQVEKNNLEQDPLEEIYNYLDDDTSTKNSFLKYSGFKLKKPSLKKLIKTKRRKTRDEKLDDLIYEPIDIEYKNNYESIEETICLESNIEKEYLPSLTYIGRKEIPDITINKECFRIGARSNNDGVINENVVSKVHALVLKQDGEYYLEDLESKNGTFVNGEIIEVNNRVKLKRGDRITFANVPFRFDCFS